MKSVSASLCLFTVTWPRTSAFFRVVSLWQQCCRETGAEFARPQPPRAFGPPVRPAGKTKRDKTPRCDSQKRGRNHRMWNERNRSPPADRFQAVAVIIFALGLGTLLPWNFFITASQYFNERLGVPNVTANGTSGGATRDYNYDSWMALLSQLPLLLFTLLNSFLYQWVRERVRVAFSLIAIFFLFSLTAALVPVPMQPDTFFSVTMATIWFINMFGAVLQGSLFGVVGLLPPRYSTLFMSGQGLAGIFAAIAMLCSILGNADKRSAALGYFITPCVAALGTLVCYLLLPHLEFARFYLNRGQSGEVESPQELLSSADTKVLNGKVLEAKGKFTGGPEESQERSSVLAVFRKPSQESLLFPAAVLSRAVFVPLLMMCNVEGSRLTVLFSHDCAFVAIVALFAFSNGYLASLCMAYAPRSVRSKDCETAGSLMTFFLVLGLALGASLSFLLGKLV
ncbi:equilibrative nucleoside transporter 2-like isoform X3 [Xiphias gladius]|uniref:equilibrative nucleoside transporter 2-like isoform X3 n=1 Tax=Xiphias gladius TaxID=8245 RepID=UPI001A9A049F|nr:equilibrative nucleoside transporter 2-like isoform X3 [Xiphias gladius]